MKKVFASIVIIAYILAGCLTVISTESELNLSSNEKWSFQMEIKAPQNQVAMYGSDLAQQFNGFAEQSAQSGIDFSWKQGNVDSDGNVPLIINAKGTGYNKWNEWIAYSGSLQSDEFLGESVIKFRLSMNSTSIGQGLTNSFTLVGGKILSTNGTQVNSTTVKWVDAGTMEAIMEPPKSEIYLWVIGIIAGVIILFFTLIFNKSGSKKTAYEEPDSTLSYNTQPFQQVSVPAKADFVSTKEEVSVVSEQQAINQTISFQDEVEIHFCGFCGEPWTREGNFCTRCGRPNI